MLQKLGRLSQAKLNEELHAGDTDMLFEKVHKMSSAVAANISQMINCQLLLIMKTDVINNISDLLFFSVAFQGLRFGDNITIFKKQIKELVELSLYLKFKVVLAMIASLHGLNQTGTDGLIALVMGFDHVNKV